MLSWKEEHPALLSSLFEFLRDLAILAAATGVAAWCWDWYSTRTERRDDAARAGLADERWRTDMRQLAESVAARITALEWRLDAALNTASGNDAAARARAAAKVRIHALLQSTPDPYLSFGEIESALARETAANALHLASSPPDAPDQAMAAPAALAGDDLRRALIELVGDRVIAQMDRDRYFIASDYETGDESPPGPA